MTRIVTVAEIEALGITPLESYRWVTESFLMKERAQLPPKVSIHPQGSDFFNTMPCLLPPEYHRFGCKVVSRIEGAVPALRTDMMMFDSSTGEMLALVDGNWITAARTGAVATLAITTLRRPGASVYSFMGLGVMGRAALTSLLEVTRGEEKTIRLLRYKDHAERVAAAIAGYSGVTVEIADTPESLVDGADVVVSCITVAHADIVADASLFRPGALVVPVHTRGFQNCDCVFDRVVADDTGHVSNFKYFDRFRSFTELAEVLHGRQPGRRDDGERILAYNIGIALHDVYFATRILERLESR